MVKAALAAVVAVGVVLLVVALVFGALTPRPAGIAATPTPSVPAPVVVEPPAEATVGIDAAWSSMMATRTGIPVVALDAYALAALAQSKVTPRCGLGWNTLAGLGYAESAHGTIDGAYLDENGQLVGAILGPVLDGSRYNRVSDTDGGVLDGDTEFDRAVGPLQFLPSTWLTNSIDGNSDGLADPNNIFDAARTAAAYLCSGSRSMATGAAWESGIRSYNPNDSYVGAVLAAANAYANRSAG